MAKAKIETPSGAKITIEGTPQEVDRIIMDYQRRENVFRQRRVYDSSISGGALLSPYSENQPFVGEKKFVSPTVKIMDLVSEGFFEIPRSLSEIYHEISNRYKVIISTSSLHPTLLTFIRKNILMRQRPDGGVWMYKVKKEGEESEEK